MRKFKFLKNWKKYFMQTFIFYKMKKRFRSNYFNIYKERFYVVK